MSESPNWSNPLRDSCDLRLPRIAGPCSLVIFGVTGDLAQKKLLPAVYDLANRGLLPPSFGLTGFARRDWTQERFIEFVKAAVQAHCRTPFKESTWRNLAAGIRFVQGTFDDPEAFERLSATVQELDRDRGTQGNHAFYMSVPPRAFPQVAKQLAASGLSRSSEGAWRRVIIEKPFGHDLASAKELDSVVSHIRKISNMCVLKRDTDISADYDNIRYFEDNEACAKALNNTDGNILLTTGSKGAVSVL